MQVRLRLRRNLRRSQNVTESRIEAELFSSSGDSGAPAYVKLGNDEVAAAGILRGSPEDDDGYTEFALIAPILDATGATLTGHIAPHHK
ncbi:hypothetical protein [Mycobacteroides chelonae]|uniref:hypothetical protein n=1 Tax=Mycobacteroides chelonae TaxID=1774 RepID=UPI000D69EA8E|nr:hypothetical protein [Mycobacteroides chelonae]